MGADAVAMEGDDVDAVALQHLTDGVDGGRGDAGRGDADGRAPFAGGGAGGLGHADHRADAFGQDPAGDDVEAKDIGHRMNDRDVAGADQRAEGLSTIGDRRDHDLGKAEGEPLHGRCRHYGALPAADPQDAVRAAGGDEVAGDPGQPPAHRQDGVVLRASRDRGEVGAGRPGHRMAVDVGLDFGLADHPDVDHQGAVAPGGDEVAAKAGLLALGVKGGGEEKGLRRSHLRPPHAYQLE